MPVKIKANGTQKELRLMSDVTTPPFASETGTSFSDNFTLVDLTNRETLCNKPSYFSYSSDQLKSGNVVDIPTGIDVNQPFIGYREVFPLHVSPDSNAHVVVKVTEYYPVLGREHYRFYNTNQWLAWKTINNT